MSPSTLEGRAVRWCCRQCESRRALAAASALVTLLAVGCVGGELQQQGSRDAGGDVVVDAEASADADAGLWLPSSPVEVRVVLSDGGTQHTCRGHCQNGVTD